MLTDIGPTNKILDAAEELFAHNGYDGASFRDITKKAGVNLAAAHYHLGDKESLYRLVFTRRLDVLNRSRLGALTAAEIAAGTEPVPMAQIVEIMVRPVFELATDPTGRGRHFMLILGRSLVEPPTLNQGLLNREFHPTISRFAQALRRHVPNLAPEEFLWRFSFVIGAMHHTLANLHRMAELTRGICRDHDAVAALQRFIPFAVASMIMPPNASK